MSFRSRFRKRFVQEKEENGEKVPLINFGDIMEMVGDLDSEPDLWSEKTQQAGNAIISLCTKLTVPSKKFKPEDWISDFGGYLEQYGRLPYTNISNFVFDLCNDSDTFDTLDINLHTVMNYWIRDMQKGEDPDVKDKLWKTLLKFSDHISLARFQYTVYLNRKVDINNAVDVRIGPKIADASKELTSQLVGLVGIFTALSFIVFGGISSLKNLFDSLGTNTSNVFPVLIIAIAWAFCFSNLLLGFMYFILRVIGRLPEKAENKNLVQQYPLVFFVNYFLASALFVCLAIWGALRTGVGKPIYDFAVAIEHSNWTFVICLGILVLLIWIPGRIIVKKYHAGRKPDKKA